MLAIYFTPRASSVKMNAHYGRSTDEDFSAERLQNVDFVYICKHYNHHLYDPRLDSGIQKKS